VIHRFALAVVERMRNDESDEDAMGKCRRWLLIFGCLGAILLAGYLTLWLTAPKHRINEHNIAAIDFGMSEKEVEEIFGVPAGDYSTKDEHWLYIQEKTRIKDGLIRIHVDILAKDPDGKFWKGDESSVWLRFDEAGKVADIWSSWEGPNADQSFLAKLRRWLGM
jgi:outer membrane protein assembly factor BamE (lipoprotein component of BamABCDE complex)